MTAALHLYWLLAGGGGLYLNKMGDGWSVDVWTYEQETRHALGAPVGHPLYHAFYKHHADAMADCDGWAKWEGQ